MTRLRFMFGLVVVCVSAACSTDSAKRAHLANGERLLEAGATAEAIIELRNAVDLDERFGEARFQLAEAYAADGNFEQAFREYVRAADLLPDNTAAQLKAGTYLVLAGQYVDAQTRVQRVLDREPQNVEAHILRGNALVGLKDLEGAITEIMDAIDLEPARGESYTNLGMLKVAQGERAQAKAAFERAVQIAPKAVGAWFALANFQWSMGDAAAAEQSLKRAEAIEPQDLLAHRALAALYAATGRPADAERHLKVIADGGQSSAGRLALADHYIAHSQVDDARKILEPLALTSTTATAAKTRLAGLAYVTGQTADAHRALDVLLRAEPNLAVALLMKARWLLSEGRRDEALEFARSAANANPRWAAALYVRGLAEAATHRTSDAITSFADVLRLNPRAAIAQVQLSRLHLVRNAIDSAVLFAEEAVKLAPESVDAQLALIRAWAARDELKRADSSLAELKKRSPDVAAIHALNGSVQLLLGQRAAARAAFNQALRLDAANLEALRGITTIDVAGQNLKLARQRLETVVQHGRSGDPELLFLLAKVLVADQDISGAEVTLRQVIVRDPLNLDAYTLLGELFARAGTLDAVRAEFDALAKQDERNLSARLMSALIVHAQGQLPDAKARYADVLKLEPRAALAANNLASIYAQERENLHLAQQLAESASNQLPAHPEVQDTLGWVYYQRHFVGQAVRQFEKSIAVDPNRAVYHYHLGLAHKSNGDAALARRAFQAALSLDPGMTDAQHALAMVQN